MNLTPNELRIGNWLLFEGKPTQVESIDPQNEVVSRGLKCAIRIKDDSGYSGKWLNHFQPIDLTPELLESIGKECSDIPGWEYQINIGALKWYFRWNTKWYSELGGIYIDSKVQHLHQVQNLYFDLIGHDLAISPSP